MKLLFSIAALLLFFPTAHIAAQKTTIAKTSGTPFQGTKKFCSYTHSSTYTITIHSTTPKSFIDIMKIALQYKVHSKTTNFIQAMLMKKQTRT
jgi:hypothetical protein